MPTTSGPQALPYPLPSDAPDGPGAFLALLQAMQVGGAIPYTTKALLVASGTGFLGQLAVVTSDSTVTNNGVYWSTGAGWALFTGPRQSVTVSPGSGITIGGGQTTLRGTALTINQQFTKSSAAAVGNTIGTLPVGFRPPTIVVLAGASTDAGNTGPFTVQVTTAGAIVVNSVVASVNSMWVSGTFEIV